jgi:pimeloyl-ACP methyl ester carboxylesterase/predicted glycosyltransferase
MRAATPARAGYAAHLGVKVHYEVYGQGGPTVLLMPTWTVVHKRFWKTQIAYLARHFRVVTYDGPGNGESGRPVEPELYGQAAQQGYALAVLDATGSRAAVLVGLSRAANWALGLALEAPDRVLGVVLIGAAVASPVAAHGGARPAPAGSLPPSRVPDLGTDPEEHWAKYDGRYWREQYEDFLWFFFGKCFSEKHSTKQIEDAVQWGLETGPEVLIAEARAQRPDLATVTDWLRRIDRPMLVLHGTDDQVRPVASGRWVAGQAGAELVLLEGAGHIPPARDPVAVNLLLADFVRRCGPPPEPTQRTWVRPARRPKRVLYLCSPIGLGHARRDLAVARALREQQPGVRIDWLTQHPVTAMLTSAGETVHPASDWLVSESAHIEAESGEHDLHCFQALRNMDEILVANFMVFHDVVSQEQYDLVIGDEAWDVDHFLHDNPELKRFAYAWLTDFVGYLPMPGAPVREHLVATDLNAEMIDRIDRFPRVRDRAVFIGDPQDVVDRPFGPGLPGIREWTRAHYEFSGYVLGEAPRPVDRARLGYRPGERVCVVTAGGSAVGLSLLRRVVAAFPAAAALVPGLRMVVVTGPRIDPGLIDARPGVDVHGYLPDLDQHLAAADLAVVQGGLSTCMELTAAGRPFVYVPLQHHFEQSIHVAHRLEQHRAGRRLDYADLTPGSLATAIAAELGRVPDYRPVRSGGAARVATLLNEML